MTTGRENPIAIRRIRSGDYARIVACWQLAGLEFRPKGRDTETNITREADSGRSIVPLAEESEHSQVIGTVIATTDGRRGYINRLAVIPEYRGRGLAGKLVAASSRTALSPLSATRTKPAHFVAANYVNP